MRASVCVGQVFMAMSVAGIVFDGYFFAFHLLNIVNNNQLLRGVIQAVTQNGDASLLSQSSPLQGRFYAKIFGGGLAPPLSSLVM